MVRLLFPNLNFKMASAVGGFPTFWNSISLQKFLSQAVEMANAILAPF
jgi:hypothetical protein